MQSSSTYFGDTSQPDGEEVAALLEMLGLKAHVPAFRKLGVASIDDLNQRQKEWRPLITNVKEREIIVGYLKTRAARPPEEMAAAEQRLRTFHLVRKTLNKLRDLQIRKVEAERLKGKKGKRKEMIDEIESVVTEIEAAQHTLREAQQQLGELPGSVTGANAAASVGGAGAPRKAAVPRMRTTVRPATATTQPRFHEYQPVKTPDIPELRGHSARVGGFDATLGASEQMKASACSSPARPPSAPSTGRGAAGRPKCAASINRPQTAGPGRLAGAAATALRRSTTSADVGHGWNRPATVNKMSSSAEVLRETQLRAEMRRKTAFTAGSLTIQGVKAHPFALGVDMDSQNYTQMKCGCHGEPGAPVPPAAPEPHDGVRKSKQATKVVHDDFEEEL